MGQVTRAAESNAHEGAKIRSLALALHCRYCNNPVYVAICRDGRWRSFERELMPVSPHGVWAWRKRIGMEETDIARGYRLHFCAEYDHVRYGLSAVVPGAAA